MNKLIFKRNQGFTIVELLIVVVVVAILAAITIVTYNGITKRAYDTSVQNDLRGISQQIKLYHAEKGVYPNASQITSLNVSVSKSSYMTSNNSMLYCVAANGSNFAIIGKSKSGTTYYSSHIKGVAKAEFNFPTGAATDCPAAGSELEGAVWLHSQGSSWANWIKG